MTRKEKYLAFLESTAKASPKNAELIGRLASGFTMCMESESGDFSPERPINTRFNVGGTGSPDNLKEIASKFRKASIKNVSDLFKLFTDTNLNTGSIDSSYLTNLACAGNIPAYLLIGKNVTQALSSTNPADVVLYKTLIGALKQAIANNDSTVSDWLNDIASIFEEEAGVKQSI